MVRPVSNPPNPWSSVHVEWLGEPPPAKLEIYEEKAKSLIVENDSPDVGFRFGVNPYRGCLHACAYCYARPSHQHLGFGAGTDFERKIVVKTNAPEVLRRELARRSWKGETIVFSGNTDCYQPVEASYGLTRACLVACLDARNPVGVITKGILVRRDADVLARLTAVAKVRVHISIPFVDPTISRALEPAPAAPPRRFEAMRALADAGVPVGIAIAPVIPGLNDRDMPELLERAKEAGATSAFMTLLRLPAEVLPVFRERLEESLPDHASKVWSQIRDVRGGRLNDSRFGHRMSGKGPRWEMVEDLFRIHVKRLGLDAMDRSEVRRVAEMPSPPITQDAKPTSAASNQGVLFDF